MSELAVVKSISIYPVKSICSIDLEKAIVTKFGLAHPDNIKVIDRKWQFINQNGKPMSQRRYPKMALIKPQIEGDFIILSAPCNPIKAKFPINSNGNKIQCKAEFDKEALLDCIEYGVDSTVCCWLNSYLETEGVNLVSFEGLLEKRFEFNSFMLISEASLVDLNSRLLKNVEMLQFRPNIVAKDCPPFCEDTWNLFQIGKSKFSKSTHCIRCVMTTVDYSSGKKDIANEPLKTLYQFRLNKDLYDSPMFGIYFNCVDADLQSEILIGDKIQSN